MNENEGTHAASLSIGTLKPFIPSSLSFYLVQ